LKKELEKISKGYFERIQEPAYIWKKDGTNFILKHVNKSAEQHDWISDKETQGMKASKIYESHPKILKSLRECYQKEGNIVKNIEWEEKETREVKFLKFFFTYVPEENVIVRIRDITHQKRVENQLTISASKYRHLFDKSPFYILLIDKEWNVIDCNKTVKKVLGYNKDEVIGNSLIELGLIDFDRVGKLKERSALLFEGKELSTIEMKIENRAGETIWIESNPSLINFNGNKIIQLVGKDINERKRIENKLKKSKQNYKELSNELEIIFNNVPAIIYYKDVNNNIIRVNEQYANRLGLEPEDLKNKSAFKIFPREMAKKYWNHDLEIIKSGEPKINFVEPMKTPSEIRWMLNSKIPVKNKKGKVIGIIGFGNDITELKKAEKQLKISERKFRRISEDAKDGIYFVNEDGIVTFWNKAAEIIFGYSKTEAIGKKLDELIIPKNRKDHFKKNIKAIKETGTSPIMDKTLELNAYTKQGEEIFMEVSHSAIKLEDKWHAIAFVREVTEKRSVERNLREAEDLFRKIAERTDMGVIILQNGELVYMNEQFPDLFGYTKQQISDWSIDDFPKCIHSEDRNFIIKQSREKQMGKGKVIRNHEFRGINKSGKIIWLNLYSNTIIYSGDLANLMTLIDITERKKTELELKQSERRYREAYELANVYKDLLAHDINNILQNIKSAVQLEKINSRNRDKSQKDKTKDYRETINEQVLRGMKLITNVRKLTKLEHIGKNQKFVDIIEVLTDSIKYVEKSFPKKNIDININSPQKKLELKANEFLLDVFENILINAVKYNENNLVIIFINILKEIQDGTQYLKMEFIDNGIGISDENKKRIFKSGAIKGKGGKGMGFGLALVKKIIHSLDGTITVQNKVKNDYTQGSNFIIRLPFES